jgi:hypothetical protein
MFNPAVSRRGVEAGADAVSATAGGVAWRRVMGAAAGEPTAVSAEATWTLADAVTISPVVCLVAGVAWAMGLADGLAAADATDGAASCSTVVAAGAIVRLVGSCRGTAAVGAAVSG